MTEGGQKGPLAQMAVGLKALAGSSTARLLAGFSVLASFYYGTDTVLLVVLSETNLGTGAEGFGYLLTALGVGGIIAAPLVNKLGSSARLGTVIAVGMIIHRLYRILTESWNTTPEQADADLPTWVEKAPLIRFSLA